MGKGGSESNTTSTSTTQNQDLRVGAEGGGVALGQGASLVYTENFPAAITEVFDKVIDFSSGVLNAANDIVTKALAQNEKTVTQANAITGAAVETEQTGQTPSQNNIMTTVIVGAVIIAGIFLFKKRG